MKLTKQQREDINKKINLITLLDNFEIEYIKEQTGRVKIRCPFHEGDNEPSLVIYTDSDPHTWWCFGCQKGSDPIQFLWLISGKNFSKIISQYGGGLKPSTLEDQVEFILASGKKISKRTRQDQILRSCMTSLSIKARSVIRRNYTNPSRMTEIHRILMQADDFSESDGCAELPEFEIKKRFREFENSLRRIGYVEYKRPEEDDVPRTI